MTGRLARLALRLYPLAFRRRYGQEMAALLGQGTPRTRDVLDLVRGGLAAHIRQPAPATGCVNGDDRARATTSGVLLCWVVFAATGLAFYKTTEDATFSAVGLAHPLLRDAHLIVQAVALVATAGVVLGGAPLIAAAVAHARRQHRLTRVVGAPLVPLIAFVVLTVVLRVIAHAQPSHRASTGAGAAGVAWALVGLGCGVACVLACRSALFATPIAPRPLRHALRSGTLVTVAMVAIGTATAVYAIALLVDASHLADSANGPFQVLSTGASLIIEAIVMMLTAALATTTSRRGWRSQ